MKQLYRPINCLSDVAHANTSTNKQFSLINRVYKMLSLLLGILLIVPILSFGKDKKPLDNPWTNTDHFWTVRYDLTEGSIHINVLYYDHKYVGDLDGWLNWAHVQYSTDGASYTNFYYLDWTGEDHETMEAAYPEGDVSTDTTFNGTDTHHYIDIKLNLTTPLQQIKKIRIWGGWVVRGTAANSDVDGVKDISITSMTSITLGTPSYNFITEPSGDTSIAKVRLNFWKYTLNDVDNLSRVQLYKNDGTFMGDTTISANGSIDVLISNTERTFYFVQSAYGGNVTAHTGNVVIPAYTIPGTASATYDTNSHRVTFTWTMDSVVNTTNYLTDRFKLQIDDNPEFSSPTPAYMNYTNRKSFTFYLDNNFSPTVWIRVARDRFDWELAKTASVAITFNRLLIGAVELQNNNKAHITWDPRPSAWLPGSAFVITRTNNTTNSQNEFRLDASVYTRGYYDDEQIAVCNQYSYVLQVQPPAGSGFYAQNALVLGNRVLPTQTGNISKMTASKGYFPDRTELRWTGNGSFESFIVKRAVYGTGNFVQLATLPGGPSGDFQTDDAKGTPGVYYTYTVVGTGTCNNQTVYSNILSTVGFRSPTGNVYGRVTYENGQAVENVAVRLQSNDQAQIGKSISFDGDTANYLRVETLKMPFEDSALTVEAWIRPTDSLPNSQVLFSRNGQYELGFNNSGKLYFTYNDTSNDTMTLSGNKTVTGGYVNRNKTFVHVAAVHTKDSMFLMLNDSLIGKAAATFEVSNPADQVYIGRRATGRGYNGYIDEIRVWNIALTPATIARDYTRLLAGNENGLAAYWRLDETIVDQFYDASHRGDLYNQNDGIISSLSVKHSNTIPTIDQLGLRDFSDASGNYMITGVPFVGNGTTYTVVPMLGTHTFDPSSANRLISTSSPVFTVDFKDKSSFAVSGSIRYRNSTVPVSGVQFKIDGQLAQQSNGAIIQTGDNGNFTISVPVGMHEVQAVKNNHIFSNNGKIIDVNGYNWNYQNILSGVEFEDLTTVRLIGRVAGGPIQDALPLGHSISSNNLGKELKIAIELSAEAPFLIQGNKDSTVLTYHLLPSNKDSAKIHSTTVVYKYNTNQLIIYPDTTTGEFAVDLIPEKFFATRVDATGWEDIAGGDVTIDLSNKFSIETSIRAYVDSTINNDVWVKTNYLDTVFYNASYKFIKREQPSVAIEQVDFNGTPQKYFGIDTYQTLTLAGNQDTVKVVEPTNEKMAMYLYGAPIFIQNHPYTFRIKAFEKYTFYESVDGTTKIPRQVNNKDLVDLVPTKDGRVSISNRIRNGGTNDDVVNLDSAGTALYQFAAGDPDLTESAKKDFSATVRFGQATYVNWLWNDVSQTMSSYVVGGKLTGVDFVTAGPEKVLFVLRDPPGAKSFSFAEQGSKITSSSKYTGNVKNEGDEEFTTQLGYELITFTGIGVGVINRVDTKTGIGFGIHHEEHYTGSDTKESSTELTTQFKTSDDPLFVGPPGDVFVGYSTNITYGQSNNITIIRKREFNASVDRLIYPAAADTANANYFVAQRAGINIGEVFGTLFAYPQQHIEKVLIPGLINIRNSNLLAVGTTDLEAQTKANTDNKPIYVSKWDVASDYFGKSNSDTVAFHQAAKDSAFGDGPSYKIFFPANSDYRTDTILILNQYVAAWKQRLADNEKAKLEASLLQNYSFHSGAPIEYSKESVVKTEHEDEFSFVIGASVANSTEFEALGSGFEFKFKEDITTEHGGTFVSSEENTMKYGFTLASEGTDDYFSVDVLTAADSAFVFRTKGGSSGCPYAGLNTTKYYQPGTIIDQPTLRNEVPVIAVDNPVATNVPSSRKAVYTLLLKNESESRLGQTFIVSYVNNDSIKGATIAIDGLSIADGRAVTVQYGETVQKVLTLERGPSAMDYNKIMILWHSACQYDPTGYRENIADTVLLAAHFIPSCSDIAIKSPKDKWVLNTRSDTNDLHQRFLPIVIDQFDVNNALFDHIELQYKPSSTSDWRTVMKFYYDPAKLAAAEGEALPIDDPAGIYYELVMDNTNFSDQGYDIQAVSICKKGEGDYVTTESNMVSGIKDTYNPRLFGSPQPANGILTVNDEVRLNFNETIAAGLLASDNFQVTGIRNGAKTDHAVSVKLNGDNNYLATEFEKSLTGKNITAEAWIYTSVSKDQVVFSHGDATGSLELSLTSDDKLQVTVGGTIYKSGVVVEKNKWNHVAMVYNDNNKTVTAFYNWTGVISAAPVPGYTGTGHIEFGRSVRTSGNYFNGQIHEARLWADTLNGTKLQLNSLRVLSGSENGLLGYYPMNEGKGNVVLDKANGSNAALKGSWSLSPVTRAVQLNPSGCLKVYTASVPISSDMDYTLELWFKGDAMQNNSVLASNGKGDGTDPDGALNLFSLGFESGVLTYRNNGFMVQATGNYLDSMWHHVAIGINRNSGSGQLSVDGQLNQFFDAEYLGGIASDTTYLGARRYFNPGDASHVQVDKYFKGYIDEFRLWNTYLDQSYITKYNSTRLNGDEVGLLAYYPFEENILVGGLPQTQYSLKDATMTQGTPLVAVPQNAVESTETAPIKSRGPVEKLLFDYVANDDAIIINVLEPKASIEKSTITFRASRIRDLHDNMMVSPVTWSAYIDQNLVKWSDKEINLVKMLGDPLTFTSYIVNNGGNSQHFTISNLPSWLMASPSSGSVDPNSNQKITFTVNSGLNIGSYEEMITMRSDNNESEVLKLTLKVKGKEPDWVVKPSDYLYNMVVYGKLKFGSVFSTNEEDMLGAFLVGKCIGVTHNAHSVANNLWYAFLTMYSNDVSNTNIEFRLWEAKTGKIYIATPSTAVSFNNNTVIGTVGNPVIFSASSTNYRNIVLNQNWNWISFNLVIPANTSLNTTLQDGNWIMDDQIKNEAASTFSNYTTTSGIGWTGTLKSLDNLTAYKLKATTAQSLPVNGTQVNVDSTLITLKGSPTWSYISYLPPFNATLKDALAGYMSMNKGVADGDVIKSQTGFAMYSSAAKAWVGSLTYMEPGKGYMFLRKATTTVTFKYPVITGSLQGGRVIEGAAATAEQRPVPANFTHADNMTVIAIVSPAFDLKAGDSIIAYVNGEVRGKAKPILNPEINKYTWFFTIAGDAEQQVVFIVERDGNMIAESSTVVNYGSNKVVGTLSKPLELQFVKLADLITVNPNPFNQQTTINVDLSRLTGSNEQVIQLSVFDVTGRTVWGMPLQKISGLKYTATWNGKNHAGAVCSSGVYIVQVAINGVPYTYKLIKR